MRPRRHGPRRPTHAGEAPAFIGSKHGGNRPCLRSPRMDVVLVQWPAEAGRRERLAEAGVARLLLVDVGSDPPLVLDALEDWVRVPADDRDVRARMEALVARAAARRPPLPSLDADGVLR